MSSIQLQGQIKLQGNIIFNTLGFWNFTTPTPGTTVSGFAVITNNSSTYTANWGDGNSTIVPSNATTSHTY
jgi:hypothetical protein